MRGEKGGRRTISHWVRCISRQRYPPVPIIPRDSRPLPYTIAPNRVATLWRSYKTIAKRCSEFGTPAVPNLADLGGRGDGGGGRGMTPGEAEHPAIY